jgi:hypothetical protein
VAQSTLPYLEDVLDWVNPLGLKPLGPGELPLVLLAIASAKGLDRVCEYSAKGPAVPEVVALEMGDVVAAGELTPELCDSAAEVPELGEGVEGLPNRLSGNGVVLFVVVAGMALLGPENHDPCCECREFCPCCLEMSARTLTGLSPPTVACIASEPDSLGRYGLLPNRPVPGGSL